MPSADFVYAAIKTELVERTVQQVPGYLNSNLNRQSKAIGGQFGKTFTSQRLGKGGVNIRRQGTVKKQNRRGPSLPKKMRLAGFKGEITGLEAIDGKRMSIRTRNRVMIAHELGEDIRAGGGKQRRQWLAVRFSKQPKTIATLRADGKRGALWAALKEAFVIRSKNDLPILVIKEGEGKSAKLRGVAFLKRNVRLKPRLQFLSTWDFVAPPLAIERTDRAIADTLKRAGVGPPQAGPEASA